MAYVSPDLAESVGLSDETVSDGSKATEANLNDNNTSTTASAEIREGMGGYKITHDLGFAVGDIDTISIRFFDGVIMTGGDVVFYPYSSGDTDVVTGNQVQVTIVDDAAYQEHDISAMKGDFGDVGTNQISIRLVMDNAGSGRGRFNEIQIEFAETSGAVIFRRRLEYM